MENSCDKWTGPVPKQYQGGGNTTGDLPEDLRVIVLHPHKYYTIRPQASEYEMDEPEVNHGEIFQLERVDECQYDDTINTLMMTHIKEYPRWMLIDANREKDLEKIQKFKAWICIDDVWYRCRQNGWPDIINFAKKYFKGLDFVTVFIGC